MSCEKLCLANTDDCYGKSEQRGMGYLNKGLSACIEQDDEIQQRCLKLCLGTHE